MRMMCALGNRPDNSVLKSPSGDLFFAPGVPWKKPTGPLVHLASNMTCIFPANVVFEVVAIQTEIQ